MLVSGHLLLSAGGDDMGSAQQRIRLLFCDLIRERVISGSPEEIHLSCCLNYQGTKACFSHLMKILQLFHILSKRSKGGCTAVIYNTEWSHLKILRSQLQVGTFKSTQFGLKIHYFSLRLWSPEDIFSVCKHSTIHITGHPGYKASGPPCCRAIRD